MITIVIGAGPAGLMAAGQAKLNGARSVFLVEKMPTPATKLALTGHGRCNLTSALPIREFSDEIWTNYKWLKHALFSFTNDDLRNFFAKLGIETAVEDHHKVFPVSQKASDIIAALIQWNTELGVKILTNTVVKKLIITDHHITGIEVESKENQSSQTMLADRVIIATGGMSYPKTGSSGDGYQLAKSIGHTIAPIRPILIALETTDPFIQSLQGLSLYGVTVSAWINTQKIAQEYGDILITHFGISGPAVLSLSRHIVLAIEQRQSVIVSIDLFPHESDPELDQRLIQILTENNTLYIANALKGLCPARLIPVCLEHIGVNAEKRANQISSLERKKLRLLLKNIPLRISSHRPLAEAIVTRGGINVAEVNPKTMASKHITGLYFAGEILDVDANTGGFNLQIAFSTGWLAGHLIS